MIPIDQQIPSIGCVVNLTVLGYNWPTLNWISKKKMDGWIGGSLNQQSMSIYVTQVKSHIAKMNQNASKVAIKILFLEA